MLVRGGRGTRCEWSVGEAGSAKGNKRLLLEAGGQGDPSRASGRAEWWLGGGPEGGQPAGGGAGGRERPCLCAAASCTGLDAVVGFLALSGEVPGLGLAGLGGEQDRSVP